MTILFKLSGFHSSMTGVSIPLGCNTVSLVIWFPTFQHNMVVSKCQQSNTVMQEHIPEDLIPQITFSSTIQHAR